MLPKDQEKLLNDIQKKYDYLEIAQSRKDPNFKEVWKAFDDLEKFESHIVDDPKLLKQFGRYSAAATHFQLFPIILKLTTKN